MIMEQLWNNFLCWSGKLWANRIFWFSDTV